MSRLLEEFKEYLKEMNQYDHVTMEYAGLRHTVDRKSVV